MDINADLGEYPELVKQDEALMPFLDSVNIACGFHAGDRELTSKTVANAQKYGLNIGAHPGFDDQPNFGRIDQELSEQELRRLIRVQLEYMREFSGQLHHVKPHGALYNMSARRPDYAQIIATEVYQFDPQLILYGLSGSHSLSEAHKAGLRTRAEVFADRAYLADGSLAPRSLPGAVLQEKEMIVRQVSQLASGLPVMTLDGHLLLLKAETICVHSDTQNAVEIVQWTRKALEAKN